MDAEHGNGWVSRFGRTLRRRPLLALVLLVLLGLRAAAPLAVRELLVSRGSEALGGDLVVGHVDLGLLRGVVILRGVAFFPGAREGNAHAASDGETPLVAWRRLSLNLSWLALVRRSVELSDVLLEAPVVRLVRRADGRWNVLELVGRTRAQGAEATAPADAASAVPPFRTAALAHLRVRSGRILLRDESVSPPESFEAALDAIDLERLAWGGEVYGEPARARLEARLEGAPVQLDGRLELRPDGARAEAQLEARGLPLSRARAYIQGLGWADLAGRLDASLRMQLEGEQSNVLSGRLTLRELEVRVEEAAAEVSQAGDPAARGANPIPLRCDVLAAEGLEIDLVAQRAALAALRFEGASLLVRSAAERFLPVLPHLPSDGADAAPSDAAPEEARPWQWGVERVEVAASELLVRGPGSALRVGIEATLQGLHSEAGPPGAFDLRAEPEVGTLAATGAIQLRPLGIRAEVSLDELPLGRLAALAPFERASWLRAGSASAEFEVTGGSLADTDDGALHVSGRLSVPGLAFAASDPEAFSLEWTDLQARFDEILVPGLLGADAAQAAQPLGVRLERLAIREPSLRLTRRAEGLVLPSAWRGAQEPAAPAQERRPFAFAVGSLVVDQGEVAVVDRTLEPAFRGRLAGIDLEARDVRLAPLRVREFAGAGTAPESGRWRLAGRVDPAETRLEVHVERLSLPPFDPYASQLVGYRIQRGAASLTSALRMEQERYDVRNSLTLHDLALQGERGEQFFLDTFGIPLALALALLRDAQGDIRLELPVKGGREGGRVGLASTLGSAFRQAILGAMASPLKVLGAVVVRDDRIAGFAPDPIAFAPGRDQLEPEGATQVARLAKLLGRRSALVLTLRGVAVQADRRALQERVLLEALRAGALLPGLGGGADHAIRDYLEARAAGRPAALPEAEQERLDALAAERDVPPERLRALARSRTQQVVDLLRQEHGVDTAAIETAEPAVAMGPGEPRVEVHIAAAP